MFEWWATVEPLAWIAGKVIASARLVRNYVLPPPPAPHWIERLNQVHGTEVCIRGLLDQEPVLQIEKSLTLTAEAKPLAAKYRRELTINDPVAVLVPPTSWSDRPVVLRAHGADYASVCALEALGHRPTILSANALLYCPGTREVLLQRRSLDSRDYAGLIHTFGGGYIPPGDHARDYDHFSLVRAARRETEEESGMSFDIAKLPPMLLGEEVKIGFVNLALLGVSVSRQTLEVAHSNHEGAISRIGADDLPRRLADAEWATAAKVHVLAWLALGAPIGRQRVRFGGESGQQIFNRIVK